MRLFRHLTRFNDYSPSAVKYRCILTLPVLAFNYILSPVAFPGAHWLHDFQVSMIVTGLLSIAATAFLLWAWHINGGDTDELRRPVKR